jgi:hypothetical protein
VASGFYSAGEYDLSLIVYLAAGTAAELAGCVAPA